MRPITERPATYPITAMAAAIAAADASWGADSAPESPKYRNAAPIAAAPREIVLAIARIKADIEERILE